MSGPSFVPTVIAALHPSNNQRCDSSDILLLEDNNTLPSVGRTSTHDVRPFTMTFLLFLSRGYL